MSRPLQVYMDESELKRLEAWTKKRGWTKSQAVRAALRVLTHEEGSDPLLASSGMIHGLPASLSASVDQAIQETFIASPQQNKKRRRVQRSVRRH